MPEFFKKALLKEPVSDKCFYALRNWSSFIIFNICNHI